MTTFRRTSSATWTGSVEQGAGQIRVGRQEATLPFSLKTRVGDEPATNPEELVGAALAGCYSMSLSNELGNAGVTFDSVQASATVHLVQGDSGFSIPTIDLVASVTGEGLDPDEVERIAHVAEQNCPVSRLYKAEVRLQVKQA